jgi:hypothetical protein
VASLMSFDRRPSESVSEMGVNKSLEIDPKRR